MNWKTLLCLPLSALILGTPLRPPTLKDPIPSPAELGCQNNNAIELYLLAYAYSAESRKSAIKLLHAAKSELHECLANTAIFQKRIDELEKSILEKKK